MMFRVFILFTLMVASSASYGVPRVVVSIAPIHSLVSMVMHDVGKPQLLIENDRPVHQLTLSPSSVRQMTKAQLIVWVGPNFETVLQKPIDLLPASIKVTTLMKSTKINRLPARSKQQWGVLNEHQSNDHNTWYDPHIWLSANNAVMIVKLVRDELMALDVVNAASYRNNAAQAIVKIWALKKEINESLQKVKNKPYLVYHDAYQYFEQEFGLNPLGAITLHPDQKLGIKSLLQVSGQIKSQQVKCLFFEPQYRTKALKQLGGNSQINTGELDPVGVAIPPDEDQWLGLMRTMRDSLLGCLTK